MSATTPVLLAMLGVLLWGIWPSLSRISPRPRWELFYIDFALGALLSMVVAAFSVGTFASEISVLDNLSIVRLLQLFFALLAGAVFNLATMMLLGGVVVAGMTTASLIAFGISLAGSGLWNSIRVTPEQPTLAYGGVVLAFLAVVAAIVSYTKHVSASGEGQPERPSAIKGILLGVISGLLMAVAFDFLRRGREAEINLNSYALGLLFGVGLFSSTLFYHLYFMNLPVQGKPVGLKSLFRLTGKQHALGMVGGLLFGVGTVALFTAGEGAPGADRILTLAHLATIPAVVLGLGKWGDLSRSSSARGVAGGAALLSAVAVALLYLGGK